MEIVVRRGGVFSTVQDLGRTGYRHAGVPLGGAMDAFALRVANLLVGNDEGAAGIEVTLGGAEFLFPQGAVVAVTGAVFEGVAGWRPFRIAAGETLKLPGCVKGGRGYVAVRGGVNVPAVLGSRSTYLRGRWGGHEGRRLQEGDRLPVLSIGGPPDLPVPGVSASWSLLPAYSEDATVRVIAGAQAGWFGEALARGRFSVTPQSDRMGLRLGGEPLAAAGARELLSTGVVPGTVQVPPDGQPIVLGVDAQTIGGYAQAAQVVSVDLSIIAQLRPGDRIGFRTITLAEAQWLALQREQDVGLMRAGLKARWDRAAGA